MRGVGGSLGISDGVLDAVMGNVSGQNNYWTTDVAEMRSNAMVWFSTGEL